MPVAISRVRSDLTMPPYFHCLEISLRIKLLRDSAFQAILNGGAERRHFLLLALQEAKPGPYHLAGVVVTAAGDAVSNKLLEMRP